MDFPLIAIERYVDGLPAAPTEKGCWEWQGTLREKRGYGQIHYHGKSPSVHRFAYELFFAPIPEGLVVRHKCDNPRCVNPTHLEIGTFADNNRDTKERGRSARGEKNGGGGKLTEKDVSQIKAKLRLRISQYKLAEEYGVSRPMIGMIARRVNWTHVEPAESIE